jgi:hypothetical protein
MKTKRTIKVVVEREREVVITNQQKREAWCASCSAQVQLVTIAEAAHLAALTELALCQQLELGVVHFDETSDGRALICLNSLTEPGQ